MVGDFNAYQKQEGVLSQIRCPENYKLIRKKGKGGGGKGRQKEASLYGFQDFTPLKLN